MRRAHVASDLKEHNRSLVYDLLRTEGALSRAEITRRSGISAPTVLKIIDHFCAYGIAGEAGEGESPLGRKPILIRFEPGAAFAVGAGYDGVHLSTGLVDLAGNIRALRRSCAPPDLKCLLGSFLADEVGRLLAETGVPKERVQGMGLGVPGVVDPVSRSLGMAPLVGVLGTMDYGVLAGELALRLGFPVVLANDANAAALGELAARGRSDNADLVFVELGRGVGAGIVVDGRLRTGGRFGAGEIGYMICEPRTAGSARGEPGWLEVRMDLGSFWDEAARGGTIREGTLERISSLLAMALANICIVLDIPTVVLGFAREEPFGPTLLGRVAAGLSALCPMEVACEAPRSAEPGVAGAASLAFESWLREVFAG